MEKQNQIQKSTHSPIKTNVVQHKINTSLVASYNIRPGNTVGVFWFQRFINLSLTYLDTYPLTYRAPDPHGVRPSNDIFMEEPNKT